MDILYRIINLVCTQNFPKNYYFLPPDKHTYKCVSEDKNLAYVLN